MAKAASHRDESRLLTACLAGLGALAGLSLLACGSETGKAEPAEADVDAFCSSINSCSESIDYDKNDCLKEETRIREQSEAADCGAQYGAYLSCAAKAGLACVDDPYDPVEAACGKEMQARSHCVSDYWQAACTKSRVASWRKSASCGLTTGPEPNWSQIGCSEELGATLQEEAECRVVTDCATLAADRCVCVPSRPGEACVDERDGG